jgi:hypothetical protein
MNTRACNNLITKERPQSMKKEMKKVSRAADWSRGEE